MKGNRGKKQNKTKLNVSGGRREQEGWIEKEYCHEVNYRKGITHKISYLFISEEVVTAILKETVLKSCLKKKNKKKQK